MSEPPFKTIAIAGLGLIGGSIALAVRERWPAMRVIGVDTDAVLAHALGSGAIDRAAGSIAALPEADLLILAAARTLPQPATFVGGHPLGGGERGGFAFARPDLFAGRPWIFTPDGERAPEALARLLAFATGLGARATTMDATAHDWLMAYVSHLPQLTASAVMAIVGGAAAGEGLCLAGKGLLDSTRLASSPADVWRDICATNADVIGEALDQLIERLTELRADLERGDTVEATFADAARWRAELMKGLE